MSIKKLLPILLLLVSGYSAPMYAIDIKILDSNLDIKIKSQEGQPYEILNEIIAPHSITNYIRYDGITGNFFIPLSARKRSKIRIDWDHQNDVFLAGRNKNEEIRFDTPGEEVGLRFNVLKPVTGNIKIFNTQGQLLKTIPFHIKKERSIRQSLRATVSTNRQNQTNQLDANTLFSNDTQYYSFGYSITQKVSNGADPYWSFDTTINTYQGNNTNKTVSSSFSYNW